MSVSARVAENIFVECVERGATAPWFWDERRHGGRGGGCFGERDEFVLKIVF